MYKRGHRCIGICGTQGLDGQLEWHVRYLVEEAVSLILSDDLRNQGDNLLSTRYRLAE